MSALTLPQSQLHCRQQARRHAKSFYFASIALPQEKKLAAYAVYAFCRYADDVVDRGGDDAATQLAQLDATFDAMLAGTNQDLAFAPAFAWAVKKYQIPKQPFFELLEGVGMDTGRVRIADWPALRHYCYHVASVVGLIMARIFECRDEKSLAHAIELGIAMQLTNILRDVREDWQMDRVYLPASELEEYGLGEKNLADANITADWRRFLQFQIQRAREFYTDSERGIPSLADDGSQLTVWLMRHVYAGILEEIEKRDYDVFSGRASTSFPTKLKLAARAWRSSRRKL